GEEGLAGLLLGTQIVSRQPVAQRGDLVVVLGARGGLGGAEGGAGAAGGGALAAGDLPGGQGGLLGEGQLDGALGPEGVDEVVDPAPGRGVVRSRQDRYGGRHAMLEGVLRQSGLAFRGLRTSSPAF